jgi:hypothetical protein
MSKQSLLSHRNKLLKNGGQVTVSYERLASKSTDPISGINYNRREICDSTASLKKSLSLSLYIYIYIYIVLLPHFLVKELSICRNLKGELLEYFS